MPTALTIAALYAGFVAFSSYLLSQLFFAQFSVMASIVGLTGLATSAGAFMLAKQTDSAPGWLRWSSFAAVLTVAADAARHHLNPEVSFNSFSLGVVGSFAACLAFIGIVAQLRTGEQPTGASHKDSGGQ